MIIKIDVDGVIRNITKPMIEQYRKDYGFLVTPEDFKVYDVDDIFPKLNGLAREYFFIKNGKYIFKDGAEVIPGAEFLNDNGIYYDDICFTRDKDLINGDIIIDDNPEFLDKEDNGIYKVCISAPYNEDFTGYDVRVDSLTDFVEKYKEQLVISLKYE